MALSITDLLRFMVNFFLEIKSVMVFVASACLNQLCLLFCSGSSLVVVPVLLFALPEAVWGRFWADIFQN